jgi:metal transporter CNNM
VTAVIGEFQTVAMKSKASVSSGRTNYNGYIASRPAIIGLAKVLFLGLYQIPYAAGVPLAHLEHTLLKKDEPAEVQDVSLWLYLAIAAVLVLLGGAFAGLTIA